MLLRLAIAATIASCTVTTATVRADAQSSSARTITLVVVPIPAGGPTDTIGRIIARSAGHHRKRTGGDRQRPDRQGCARGGRRAHADPGNDRHACVRRRGLSAEIRCRGGLRADRADRLRSADHRRQKGAAGRGPRPIDRLAQGQPRQGDCRDRGCRQHVTRQRSLFDWHHATRRQSVINLDAPHQVSASNGETRTIGAGEIILYEDLHGKGHLSQGLGMFRHSVMIPVD